MKIAVSAAGGSLDAEVEPRFGRCHYFVVADSDTMRMEVSANAAAQARGGAGPQAAQTLKGLGVEVVLTGNVGPNAEQALGAAGIKTVTGVTGKVRTAVEDYVAEHK